MSIEWKDLRRVSRKRFLGDLAGVVVTAAVIDSPALPLLTGAAQAVRAVAIAESGIKLAKAAPGLVIQTATETPLVVPRSIPDKLRGKVYPGSLEDTAIEATGGLSFIDPKKGPYPLVEAVVLNDSHLLESTRRITAETWAIADAGGRPLPGNQILDTHRREYEYLKLLEAKNLVIPGTNLHLEAHRRMVYAVTLAGSPDIGLETGKAIGKIPKDAPDDLNIPDWIFSKGGYGKEGNPIIYGVENATNDPKVGEPFEQGSERWGHLVYYLFDGSSQLFFDKIGHPLKDATPFILRAPSRLARFTGLIQTTDGEVRFATKFVGLLYEGKTTFNMEQDPENFDKTLKAVRSTLMQDGSYYTSVGFADTRVGEDLEANDLGGDLSIMLFDSALNSRDPQPITDQLNDPKFKWTGNGRQFLVPVGAGR